MSKKYFDENTSFSYRPAGRWTSALVSSLLHSVSASPEGVLRAMRRSERFYLTRVPLPHRIVSSRQDFLQLSFSNGSLLNVLPWSSTSRFVECMSPSVEVFSWQVCCCAIFFPFSNDGFNDAPWDTQILSVHYKTTINSTLICGFHHDEMWKKSKGVEYLCKAV